MNRYQLLKDNEEINFQYIRNGILSYQLLRDMEIYERFNELDEEISNGMKYILLSDEFELGVKRVQQIIINMNKKISKYT